MTLSPFYQDLVAGLNSGLTMSIALIVPSACGGVFIGISAGALRVYGSKPIRRLGGGYAAQTAMPRFFAAHLLLSSFLCSITACPIWGSISVLMGRR